MDLPEELNKVRAILDKQPNGSRDFAHILSYIPKETIESVTTACCEALTSKTVSKDVILNILFRKNDQDEIVEKPDKYIELKNIPQDNCEAYDDLLQGGYNG